MFDLAAHWLFPTHAVSRPGPMPPGAEKLEFEGPSGHRLVGIHIPADRKKTKPLLILGFGGNAWNAQDVAEYLHEIFPNSDVVSFYYRGYAPSRGEPSADALIADAPAVYDFAVDKLKPAKTIAIGLSIGTGVASVLSTERQLDGVILVTPFDSLRAVAQSAIPWIPIGPFLQHELDAASALEKSGVKVAILAGAKDDIVPPERTDALRARVPNLVFDRTIADAGHNSIYARSSFQLALREARDRLIS